MTTIETILGIALMIISIVLIICNLMKPKSEGGLTIGFGGNSDFMQGKMQDEKEKTLDIIIWVCIALIVIIAVTLNYLTLSSVG